MELLIKNIRLVDKNIDQVGDIYIEDGIIEEIGLNLEKDARTIDGRGHVLMPAFVDLHAHFREPGFEKKETIETGSMAALKGGYTTLNLMANTNPIVSNMKIVDSILSKSRDLDLVDIHQTVSVTKNFDGKTLDHLNEIDSKKVRFISDDGFGVISNRVMYDALELAKDKDFIIMSHAEDMNLTEVDYRISENIITFRDLYLSEITGGRLHMSHVSTKEAINAIREAKKRGVPVTCEVTPHHIFMKNSDYRVNPPIRESRDVEALIEAIKDGTVDAIGTDHAPHTEEDKLNGAAGISGIETAFSICLTSLVKTGEISLSKLSEIMSARGAEIMGVKKGLIQKGYIGDLVLLDIDSSYEIDSSKFISKGKNTPLNGVNVFGEVLLTLVAGDIKYRSSNFLV